MAEQRTARTSAVAAVAAGLTLASLSCLAATAARSSASTAAPAASCADNPKQNAETVKTKWYGSTEIQLRYSRTCATAWALETGGFSGDHLWVYNRDTHAQNEAYYPNITGAIGDSGTESHACMQGNGMPKTCTDYF